MKGSWSFSIRAKIVILVASALTVSLCSYLYIGTSLIIGDKVSYIYDYNLSQSRFSAKNFDAWLAKVVSNARMAGAFQDVNLRRALFDRFEKMLGVEGILYLRPRADGFSPDAAFGRPEAELQALFQAMHWTLEQLNQQEMLLGTTADGKLCIASYGVDDRGQALSFFAIARAGADLLKGSGATGGSSNDTSVFLYDANGRRLTQAGADKYLRGDLSDEAMRPIIKELLSSTFQSGVREWASPAKQDYILSYERLGKTKFTVVAGIPKSTAFAAAYALVQRSFALGVSILMASIGAAMLFVRGLTRRIRELWFATKKVSEGDFSVRVETHQSTDEISSLGASFNAMADRIDELMDQTAEKARMEKELETAQAVQNRFFPVRGFEHPALTLAGRVVPASECGGDWWFYAPLGNLLIVVIGDVTGHGVSSALVTAAVHGGFSMLVQKFQKENERPSMKEVVETMNGVVCAAARQEVTMTFIASLVDLDSGQMEFVNASHRPPYIYRDSKFKPLMDAKCAVLGQEQSIQAESATVDLEPGDVVLWYTDGVLECTNPEGKTISRSALVKMVGALNERHPSDATGLCEDFMKEAMGFFGNDATHLADDVTIVFGSVSKDAHFKRDKAAA